MSNDEKISRWIEQKESEGMSRDEIARAEFVAKRPDGTFTTYRLGKSGKTKYTLKGHAGAISLDGM